ncbi:fumarylacetoacetate hydrolase FahA [Aulographum hederae CBS 113979]|uniref:Fumarylacetoacetase n=1 Tax=Aulographum hederae CBS 113979 TaxID=1176131 RepID=A0A6G1GV64_9PEZI|nr:fumarylacetoacetate hydrolase FahA [Aulographum hederae CBS 113979]
MASRDYAKDFGPNNIPFGIASTAERPPQCVSRIGNTVIFLADLAKAGAFSDIDSSLKSIFQSSTLNAFAALPTPTSSRVRSAIQKNIATSSLPPNSTTPISTTTLHLPLTIPAFTDFSASKDHVLNASSAVFGRREMPPAFLHYPVAYAGRASSIAVSGTPVERPLGQFRDGAGVVFGASRAMDFELELGAVIGRPVGRGQRVKSEESDGHVFGFVVVNDWSARDIQGLEMNPLGPMNGKNFATTISPWVVTLEALEPFRVAAPERDVEVAPYLRDSERMQYDLTVEAEIINEEPKSAVVCHANSSTTYWTFRDMIAHHTIGGCNLDTGDLIASGTISGTGEWEHGCLLESTMGGKKELDLGDGFKRTYLQDGDSVLLTCRAGNGEHDVGFGECIGQILPARDFA